MPVTSFAEKDLLYPVPSEEAFDLLDEDGNEERRRDYAPADDLHELAADVMEHHGHKFAHLSNAAIGYRWKRQGGRSAGKMRMCEVLRPSGLLADETGLDYVVWLAADHLSALDYTRIQVEATLFHCLCRTSRDDKTGQFRLAPPDAQFFISEIENYGLWRNNLKLVGEAVRQMRLWDSEAAD